MSILCGVNVNFILLSAIDVEYMNLAPSLDEALSYIFLSVSNAILDRTVAVNLTTIEISANGWCSFYFS